MLKINFYKIIFISMLIFVIIPSLSYALPTRIYLNDSTQFSSSANITFSLSSNLTIEENINHTFEGRSSASNADWDFEYVASNATGFLIRLRIRDEPDTGSGPAADDRIDLIDCIDTTATPTTICGPNCGGNDFAQFHNFTLLINSSSNNADLFIDGIKRTSASICTNATLIGSVRFSRSSTLGTYIVKNNLLKANNKNPNFIGNLTIITWPEDTSTSFNISGNFSDPNNDTLTYGTVSSVENITITINSSTGIVNLTPSPNFFGIRNAIFFANDSDNITLSNNVTLNVTNVNDVPIISDVMLNNTDFLNRTNGSLVVGWTFNDVDNDAQQGNETLWYINGTENIAFRNFTTINSTNTTKTQNWTFSVRVSDGTIFSIFVNSTFLIIQNAAPTHTTPAISSNDEHNRKNGTLTCNNQSTNDLDNDAITNFMRWYKNNALVDTALNSTTLNVGNYSKNDNITCEITPNDGAINGTALNSTNFTILNAATLLNNSVQNKTWDEDTSTTINISSSFVDIDNDNLTYNFTSVSNIAISINNNTGIATLTPDHDFNGARNILFFAFDGINLTNSNNITLTVNDVAEPSPPAPSQSSGGGGGGGGGGLVSGYICDSDWKCEEWGECVEGKQTRKCILVKITSYFSLEKCPQNEIPEQSKDCKALVLKVPVIKESCFDKTQNQNEIGIDCGGPCKPCFKAIKKEKNATQILGPAVVAQPKGFNFNLFYLISIILLILTTLIVYKVLKKKIKRKKY